MKKRMNTIFFSICFLAALMVQAYCIHILNGEIVSVIGLSIVVLITGYLWLDSIRGLWVESSERVKVVLEKKYATESRKLEEKYQELLNIQKATYTVLKRNDNTVCNQMEELNKKIDSLTKSYSRMIELQATGLEGQQKALNLILNYNRENTKMSITSFKEEINKLSNKDQIDTMIVLLSEVKEEISKKTMLGESIAFPSITNVESDESTGNFTIESDWKTDSYFNNKLENDIKTIDTNFAVKFNEESIDNTIEDEIKEAPNEEPQVVIPLYDDPNKALTTDEIAKLFASYGQ